MRSPVLILSLCVALFALPLSGANNDVNLAKGIAYTYVPKPTYPHCTDARDVTQLTDGLKASGRLWMLPSTVGWSASNTSPALILFDLGREATLSALRVNTVGGGSAGVQDVGVRVYVSRDNHSYVFAREFPTPRPVPKEKHTIRSVERQVPLGSVRARYVAVTLSPPERYSHVFADEVEIIGHVPADPASALPAQAGVTASGAKELHEAFSGGQRLMSILVNLTAPVEQHMANWPASLAEAQRDDLKALAAKGALREQDVAGIRADFTEAHRKRAREAYQDDVVVWEVVPDERFTPLSLPIDLAVVRKATIETAVNAMEATALGVANLTGQPLPLTVRVQAGSDHAPVVTLRIARFVSTAGGMVVPDALLANDGPSTIPPGEAKLVWLIAETPDAAPGLYTYQVTLTVDKEERPLPLAVIVHDVTLSHTTPLSTGNWSYLDTGETPLYAEVRDEMLAHRVTNAFGTSNVSPFPKRDENGDVIRPVQLDFTAMDGFLDFHEDFDQVSWFLSFNPHSDRPQGMSRFGKSDWMSDEFTDIFREWLTQIVAHLKERGRDYGQFYFQFFDERLNEKVADCCRLVHEIDPNVRVMITFYTPAGAEEVESFANESGMDIFVHHATRVPYTDRPDGYPILSSNGRELWIYGAAHLIHGNGRERDPMDFYRIMYWKAFYHHATGVHFWNMLHYRRMKNGWEDESVGEVYYPFVYLNGQDHPPVPEDVMTSEKVVPSRRWLYSHMGTEDFMLLTMAQERIDAMGDVGAPYQKRLDEMVETVLGHRFDRAGFRKRRRELLELVEALSRQ